MDAELTPFDTVILREVCQLQRHLQRPAPSRLLAESLNVPSRTMRYYLNRLERGGHVARPNGARSGYEAPKRTVMRLQRRDFQDRMGSRRHFQSRMRSERRH
jgi:Mn-dependent DtxR family transcriptional regulator